MLPIKPKDEVAGFAQYLLLRSLITEDDVSLCRERSRQNQRTFIANIIEAKILEDSILAQAIAEYFKLPFANLDLSASFSLPKEAISIDLMLKYRVLPLASKDGELSVGVFDPTDTVGINAIKFHTESHIKVFIVEAKKINTVIDNFVVDRNRNNLAKIKSGNREEDIADAPIVKFIDDIFFSAIYKKASDVHFEPYEKHYRIRFRIDGILHEISKVDLIFAKRFSSRLKVMSRLDIAEQRLPQDGRFTMFLHDDAYENFNDQGDAFLNGLVSSHRRREYDCRISICPTTFGERIVVRILNPDNISLNIDALGFESLQKQSFLEAIKRASGLVLVTGPTGSGKTLSLYTALTILNSEEKNILTVEDPVEINLSGINQLEVNKKIGLDFSQALRSFLRQDPDVIMVGEIRDLETLQIAIRASQTGHLVLATLHTNTAFEAITRMLNMGISALNIVNSLSLVVAQRLVRKLCPFCKEPQSLDDSVFMGDKMVDRYSFAYKAKGCDKCHHGYIGRIGIFECLSFNEEMGRILMRGGDVIAVSDYACEIGFKGLHAAAWQKVEEGITSLKEVDRVL